MTEYVLEILDGDRAGELFELTSEPVSFGRRPGNDLVLSDEKVSGQHATLVLEDGQWVLRDLDSTNGTLMDGRRIQEVGLTANDIFQLGRIYVGFKEAGAPTPQRGGDLEVRTVDKARLAKTRRGGGIGLLVVVLLLLGGVAGYWFYGGGEAQVSGGGSKPRAVVRVAGNMLGTGADMESEGGWELVSGLEFGWEDADFSSANSGRGCLLVLGPESEGAPHFALSRSTEELLVSSGSGVKATAYLRTGGKAKAAIRLRFWSTAEGGQPVVLFSGTVPSSYEDYTQVSLSAGVPSGCDHAAIELLALLPDADSEVTVDDVAFQEGEGDSYGFTTQAGQRFAGGGGALVILDANSIVMSSVRPLTTDPCLLELDKLGHLGLSDAGMDLQVSDEDGAVKLVATGGVGLALVFDASLASSGVLASSGEQGFTNHASPFSLTDVDNLLFGYGTSRLLVQAPAPVAMHGSIQGGRFVLNLPASSELSLVYDFTASRQKARSLLADAREKFADGEYATVTEKVDTALSLYPHDDRQHHEITRLRSKVRSLQSELMTYLKAELENAVYFESLGGYRRIRQELSDLVRVYGEGNLLDPAGVEEMRGRVDSTIQRIERAEGAVARQKLQTLAGVYGKAGSAQLVALINQYIKDYLPAADENGEDK